MNIELIKEEFNTSDAIEIIVQMVHLKIRHQENKINSNSTDEEIKSSEVKIIRLHKELFEFQKSINSKKGKLKIETIIKID